MSDDQSSTKSVQRNWLELFLWPLHIGFVSLAIAGACPSGIKGHSSTCPALLRVLSCRSGVMLVSLMAEEKAYCG